MFIIGITGYKGLLGHYFLEHDGAKPIEADVTDYEALARAIDTVCPDAIVHCAAKTNVDWCEQNPADSYAVNVIGTLNVISASQGVPVVLISTDYVFDGKNGPYTEDDLRDPINIYGKQKAEAEDLMRPQDLICRTTVLYGLGGHNKIDFVFWVRHELYEPQFWISTCWDQWGTPTYAENLATMIRALIKAGYSGIWHTAGAACISRLQFARIIANVFGLDEHRIRPESTIELGQVAKRPRHGGLIVAKFQEAFPSILCMMPYEGLMEMKQYEDRLCREF